MLQNIHIQNFRCFEDFKADGFERINLIGGKNNSGKTCLLEGLYLNNKSSELSIDDFVNARKSNANGNQDNESYSSLFFHKRTETPIKISTGTPDSQFKFIMKNIVNYGTVNEAEYSIKWRTNTKVILDKYTQIPLTKDLAIEYSIADRLGKSELILKTLQLIDSNIQEIKTYSDTPILYLKTIQSSLPIPINYFGDAIQKLVRYIIAFADFNPLNEGNLILIDEIENGLHYTAHYDFWKNIFKLSKELNVQVFATTHSLEMIQQFNKVAKEEGEGAYFEMVRDEKTNQIEAIKHSTNVLEEEIETDMKFRGEVFRNKIELSQDIIDTLQNSLNDAKEVAKEKNIALPFIREGRLYQLNPDGTETLLKELEKI